MEIFEWCLPDSGAQSTATAVEQADLKATALGSFLQLGDIKEEEEYEYKYVHADLLDLMTMDIKRVDLLDLTTMDIKLEEHLAAKAAWEIDLLSQHIQRVVAHGVHRTLFRAEYCDQDVIVKLLD
ncbi:hypothetical protein GUJ93_ZPchr0008g14068 [Zizania palustris]|uniref:Uncharacterized protein n=1 Tax=Zizania palustris TaxID=103762 RepID=A0A8J5R7F3_ZIZPA|nr:hypothetical protein GUJ93_ZPchr0008g14068 [Zizania palustris]